MTLDEIRRLIDNARCQKCCLPRDAAVHSPNGSMARAWCKYRLDREALANAIWYALHPASAESEPVS